MLKFIVTIMLFILLFFLFGFLIFAFNICGYGLFSTKPVEGFLALTTALSGITTYVIVILYAKYKK